ncbi:MAG: YcxB family protein [Eubacteriales bacterium]
MDIDKKYFYKKRDYINRGIRTYFIERRANLLFITIVFILCILAIVYIKGQISALIWVMIGLYLLSQISMPITIFFRESRRQENSREMKVKRHIHITENGTNGLEWDAFYKIVLLKNLILLYVDSNQSFMLPKRVFEKEEYKAIKKMILKNKSRRVKVKKGVFL